MAVRKKVEKSQGTPTVKEQTITREEGVKYRCDFKSYKEYNAYKGKKA